MKDEDDQKVGDDEEKNEINQREDTKSLIK